ncbi:MAG: methylated-DNA--[protein]-cysteine S-methyltransferase [Actinobacteria bacterium]|nr:methylated-DNA--[protein]-cysteine S-methyltransferase [Actinomycetota bacterium]
MTVSSTLYDGPQGQLLLAVRNGGEVVRVAFVDGAPNVEEDWVRNDGALVSLVRQLDEYFAGERTEFELALAPEGTPFQLEVWEALRAIPYGETISYGELASRVGRPGAARAVGAANGRNPLSIVVPCHRVIGANGTLTGFGGGLGWKRCLLELEAGRSTLPMRV